MFSFDEFGSEEDSWRPEKSKIRRFAEKAFAVFFVCFVFGIIGLMTFRLFASKPPKSMKSMIWNDSISEAYETYGDSLEIKHILTSESFSEDAMFSIASITRCVQTGQVQMTVRYNNRVLGYLEKDFPGAKQTDGEIYLFTLKDNFGKEYTSYSYTKDEKLGYTYRHLIFENVDFEDVSEIKLYVSYSGDPDAGIRHTLYVYRYDFNVIDYDFIKPQNEKREMFFSE